MSRLQTTVVKGVIVGILAGLAMVSGFFASRAYGARPSMTLPDPNGITFAYDVNQVAGSIIGWDAATAGVTWTKDFWFWCSEDRVLQFTVSHGAARRTNAVVDANTAPPDKTETHEVSFTPTAAGVHYLQVTTAVAGDPNSTKVNTYLLNVTPRPIETWLWVGIPWWYPHAEAYINNHPDSMATKQVNWQKFRKTVSLHVRGPRTPRNINNSLFVAYMSGQVQRP